MLIAIILGLAVIIAGVLIASRFQPDNYTVQRTGTIAAPPSVVFAQVANFRSWEKFDPCLQIDANTVSPTKVQRAVWAPSTVGRATPSVKAAW
jgi:hypothetical protein